jgi:hypothetical protein
VLHNIGRLARDQRRPEGLKHAVRHAREHQLTLPDAEHDVLGFSDAQLGAALCARWGLPETLVDAVGHHLLDPEQLPPAGSLTAAVVRARVFVRSAGLGDGLEAAGADAPLGSDWEAPPLSVALARAGGMEGVLGRASAFIDAQRWMSSSTSSRTCGRWGRSRRASWS